jgi:hypothetical protein
LFQELKSCDESKNILEKQKYSVFQGIYQYYRKNEGNIQDLDLVNHWHIHKSLSNDQILLRKIIELMTRIEYLEGHSIMARILKEVHNRFNYTSDDDEKFCKEQRLKNRFYTI